MKKLLALVISLMLCCSFALAEDVNAIAFDIAVMETMPGSFQALEEYGLMMYIPEDMFALEMTQEDIDAGCYATLVGAEGNIGLTIACVMVYDAEGKPATTLEDVAALYVAGGMTDATVGLVNELPCVAYSRPEVGMMGVDLMLTDGSVLNFIVTGIVDEATMEYAYVLLSSIMVLQYAE